MVLRCHGTSKWHDATNLLWFVRCDTVSLMSAHDWWMNLWKWEITDLFAWNGREREINLWHHKNLESGEIWKRRNNQNTWHTVRDNDLCVLVLKIVSTDVFHPRWMSRKVCGVCVCDMCIVHENEPSILPNATLKIENMFSATFYLIISLYIVGVINSSRSQP